MKFFPYGKKGKRAVCVYTVTQVASVCSKPCFVKWAKNGLGYAVIGSTSAFPQGKTTLKGRSNNPLNLPNSTSFFLAREKVTLKGLYPHPLRQHYLLRRKAKLHWKGWLGGVVNNPYIKKPPHTGRFYTSHLILFSRY